ncbi:MAG: cytochrome c peroxidase [Arcobacteraceae bacterium]|nr:cytochrome c peroxidase [Arcobacteraceae bacterium]
MGMNNYSVKLLSLLALTSVLNAAEGWIIPSDLESHKNNNQKEVNLGKLLFFDTRLSKNNNISCATCHNPNLGWSDGMSQSIGDEGKKGRRNSPTIINSAFNHHQFWDGRAKTLEIQALLPIQDKVEMNMILDELIKKLNAIDGYKTLFDEAYPQEGITENTVAKALASFERTVVSLDSPFDKYIAGDKNAISDKAKKGFVLFETKAGCTNCHSGFNFTDGSFHNIGLDNDDTGRYEVKKHPLMYGAFKTPTLRGIDESAPYFHDGSIDNLVEATDICSRGGKNPNAKNISTSLKKVDLSKEEQMLIVEFMKTLNISNLKIEAPSSFPK